MASILPERRQNLQTYVHGLTEFQKNSAEETEWLSIAKKQLEDRLALYSAGRTVSDENKVGLDKIFD